MAVFLWLPVLLTFAATVLHFPRAERIALDESPDSAVHSEAGRLDGEVLLEQSRTKKIDVGDFLACDSLHHVVNCARFKPEYLGVGAAGQAWLVQDLSGREVVIKLLHHKNQFSRLMYGRELKGSYKSYQKEVDEAAEECEKAKTLAKGSDNELYKGHGQQRIMRCLSHNINTAGDDEPLYMLLENAGPYNLWGFWTKNIEEGNWNVAMVRQVAKQLLEGLAYLQSFKQPWIHHDMKPENVAVMVHSGGENGQPYFFTLKLVDLGAMVHHNPKNWGWCQWRASTPPYDPPENGFSPYQFGCHKTYYDPKHPKAYDTFAAAGMLFELVTGSALDLLAEEASEYVKLHSTEPVTLPKAPFSNPFNEEQKQFREAFEGPNAVEKILAMSAEKKPGWANLISEILADSDAVRFYEHVIRALWADPEERPPAEVLLKEPWMQSFESFDDPASDKDVSTIPVAAEEPRVEAVKSHDVPTHGENRKFNAVTEEQMHATTGGGAADVQMRDAEDSAVTEEQMHATSGGVPGVQMSDAKESSWFGSLIPSAAKSVYGMVPSFGNWARFWAQPGAKAQDLQRTALAAKPGAKRRMADEDATSAKRKKVDAEDVSEGKEVQMEVEPAGMLPRLPRKIAKAVHRRKPQKAH